MSRKYVLDTNIFIYEPDCLSMFDEHDLFISSITLREISGLKNREGEVGYSARKVKSKLDELRYKNPGESLLSGLSLGENLGKLFIIQDVDYSRFLPGMDEMSNDSAILAGCCYLQDKFKKDEVILVTDDVDMSLFADILEIKAQHFRNHSLSDQELSYTGRGEVYVPTEQISMLRNGKPIHTSEDFEINEFLIARDASNPDKNTVLCMYSGLGEIKPLEHLDEHPSDIRPKNSGQRFMQEAMLASPDDIPLVIVSGPAGTAKTFISLACGLEKTLNRNEYKRILITRANVEMDATYGFLPGSESEKVGPMMRPFYDNLEKIITSKTFVKDGRECPSPSQEMFDRGIIRMEALQYMRGRSISDTYVIIDEAQNCTPNQILSIVSRIGYGSKIVLIGDPNQIDNKILNKRNNGLVFAARRFKGSKLCAQIVMEQSECVRSPLAAEAARRLSADYREDIKK